MPITPNLQNALLGYISGRNADVGNSARAQAAATGFANNTPEYTNAFRNAVIDHAMANGVAENRPGAEQLVNVVTNERNQGFNPVTGLSVQIDTMDGPSGGGSDNASGGGSDNASGGGSDNASGGGSDNASGIGSRLASIESQLATLSESTGGGIMEPVELQSGQLNPVTNLIGATADTDQTTLMGRQAGLASDIAGVQTNIGTPDATSGQAATIMGQTQALATGQTGLGTQITDVGTQVGNKATDTAGATGLYEGQADIMQGQTGLADTQANILEGQTGLAGTQAGLMSRIGDTATATAPATGLIGAVGSAGTPGTATQAATLPTGLFAGQQALGTNVTGARRELGAVGKDVSGIASSLANFENISSQERANLLSTLNTRAQELENLENMYGFQTNRLVEAQLGNTGSTGLQPGMMQPPPTDPGSLNSILAAERAAQATGQNISANLTSAANQGLVSNALGPVGTQ